MKIPLLIFLSVATLTTAAQQPTAQPTKAINANDFVMECMHQEGDLQQSELAFWIPVEFWKIVGDQMKLSPDAMSGVVAEMNHYMMFCVGDYSVINQQLVFRTADEIRPSLKLVDSAKNIYLPLADKDISPTALILISKFQPSLAKMLGQFGNGITIFLFDTKNEKGISPFDVSKPNRFTLTWDNASLKWRLPFAAVLPVKYCPVDNEPMKGNWNFCPIHGAKLN